MLLSVETISSHGDLKLLFPFQSFPTIVKLDFISQSVALHQ